MEQYPEQEEPRSPQIHQSDLQVAAQFPEQTTQWRSVLLRVRAATLNFLTLQGGFRLWEIAKPSKQFREE
jgi:hypothetical protein